MTTDLLIIIFSLILSAFFSGMEIAYVSSNKIHIEIEKKQKGLLSKLGMRSLIGGTIACLMTAVIVGMLY